MMMMMTTFGTQEPKMALFHPTELLSYNLWLPLIQSEMTQLQKMLGKLTWSKLWEIEAFSSFDDWFSSVDVSMSILCIDRKYNQCVSNKQIQLFNVVNFNALDFKIFGKLTL